MDNPPETPASRLAVSLRKRGVMGVIAHLFLDAFAAIGRRLDWIRDHASATTLSGNLKDSESLIVILAGYKPLIWPLVLRRIAEHAPADAAVCVVTAGKSEPKLAGFCAKMGWSYLSVAKNKTGLALNK